MEIITLNKNNIDNEHICCAISDKKCREGYEKKKGLLKEEIDKGYSFKKFNVNHKVFIEYCPSDISWLPINADNYMVINCFWVAGMHAGKGYGKKLLDECFKAAENMNGVVVLTSSKKKSYMSDKRFFIKQGFEVCDTADPYFELLVYKNKKDAEKPTFKDSVKKAIPKNDKGLCLYYSNFCPFTENYAKVLTELADKSNVPIEIIKINNREEGIANPSPFIIYSLFYNGKFLTHEILNEKKFEKLILAEKMNI